MAVWNYSMVHKVTPHQITPAEYLQDCQFLQVKNDHSLRREIKW